MKTDLTTLVFDDLMKDPRFILKLYNSLFPERKKRRTYKIKTRPVIDKLKNKKFSLLRLKVDDLPIFIIQANMSFEESELKEIAYCFLTGLQTFLEEENLTYEEWVDKIYLESEFFILCTNIKTISTEISLSKDIYRVPKCEMDLNFNVISKCEENNFLGEFFKLCRKLNLIDIFKYTNRNDVREFVQGCIKEKILAEYFSESTEEKVEMIYDHIRMRQIEIEMRESLDQEFKLKANRNRILDQMEVLYELGLSPLEILDRISESNSNLPSSDICEWYSDYYRQKE